MSLMQGEDLCRLDVKCFINVFVFIYVNWCPTRFLVHIMLMFNNKVTRQVPYVEQELLTLPEAPYFTPPPPRV